MYAPANHGETTDFGGASGTSAQISTCQSHFEGKVFSVYYKSRGSVQASPGASPLLQSAAVSDIRETPVPSCPSNPKLIVPSHALRKSCGFRGVRGCPWTASGHLIVLVDNRVEIPLMVEVGDSNKTQLCSSKRPVVITQHNASMIMASKHLGPAAYIQRSSLERVSRGRDRRNLEEAIMSGSRTSPDLLIPYFPSIVFLLRSINALPSCNPYFRNLALCR
ncbi:MAG: hypothetical protein NXY57DRAFT_258673 [Lentinula lateritia]|nr:MAG: hypothetical protein NXY57DRAFT_258673 [Lentinula lateritia]